MNAAQQVISAIRSIYGDGQVPLHRPVFLGKEREYLSACIDSNFVSSVGKDVNAFEKGVAAFTGAKFAIATVNGTAALHASLILAGVRQGDEVISQALTFVATCNALSYVGAEPVFIDVDIDSLGMSPEALRRWLTENAICQGNHAVNRITGRRIAACVPMHTFGFPLRVQEIVRLCDDFGIPVIEDAAESLGSFVAGRHTGTFGRLATLSFNGNKVITTGGGGMILTDDADVAQRAKHLTTTAKVPHSYEFVHDEVGYNYRLPNLNAALGRAQLESLGVMLDIKREIAVKYRKFFESGGIRMVGPLPGTTANYWLNAVIVDSRGQRDEVLELSNSQGVMTRPIWRLMSRLPMYQKCQNDGLRNSQWLEDRVVNLPSSVPESEFIRLQA